MSDRDYIPCLTTVIPGLIDLWEVFRGGLHPPQPSREVFRGEGNPSRLSCSFRRGLHPPALRWSAACCALTSSVAPSPALLLGRAARVTPSCPPAGGRAGCALTSRVAPFPALLLGRAGCALTSRVATLPGSPTGARGEGYTLLPSCWGRACCALTRRVAPFPASVRARRAAPLLRLTGLAGFAAHAFALILDTIAFIRLGRANVTHLGGFLTD